MLWLFVASGWLVVIEPAPYEYLFPLVFLAFLPGGLAASLLVAPMILFLSLYNAGGFLSALQVSHGAADSYMFVAISSYMAITAMFFAFATTARAEETARVVRSAWVVAGVIAAINGLIGYFDIAGMGKYWAPIARAQGTFKDPNVLSTFLVPPAVFLVQDFMLGNTRRPLLKGLALLVIMGAIFLAFSRGAWAVAVGSFFLTVLITFATTTNAALRSRIVLMSAGLAILAAILLTVLLSIPQVRELFLDRFTLLKEYDAGETGRFANQLRSIPMLLERPNGFGPHQFGRIFGEDPHNVYINAFAAYGWLGGISYLLLTLTTIGIALRAILTPTPWRRHAIAFFAPLFMMMLQGIQIDTDHWRHFYLLLGMVWGLFAASEIWLRRSETMARGSQATFTRRKRLNNMKGNPESRASRYSTR